MLLANDVPVSEGKIAILGTGGARKACEKALKDLGANTLIVSRNPDRGITYEECIAREKEISIIVNTTPVGMKPDYEGHPIDIKQFSNLRAVVDIVANPIVTRLQFEAKALGIKYLGGFEMLVRQALEADKLFLKKEFSEKLVKDCEAEVLKEKRNIVLIGMTTSIKQSFIHFWEISSRVILSAIRKLLTRVRTKLSIHPPHPSVSPMS